MKIFVFLSILVAATANKNESVNDASVALQVRLQKKSFTGVAYLFLMPKMFWLEWRPQPEHNKDTRYNFWQSGEDGIWKKRAPTLDSYEGADPPQLRVDDFDSVLKEKEEDYSYSGKSWTLYSLISQSNISPLFLKSKTFPPGFQLSSHVEAVKEKWKFVQQVVCSWYVMTFDALRKDQPKLFPAKSNTKHPCFWSFGTGMAGQANETVETTNTLEKNGENDYFNKQFGDGNFKPEDPGQKIWDASKMRLESTHAKSGVLGGIVSEPGILSRQLITFRHIPLSDYSSMFESNENDGDYAKVYKQWVTEFAGYMLKEVKKLGALTDHGKVEGFLHLLCNRIVAILARNPEGYNAKNNASEAKLPDNHANIIKADTTFLKRFNRIKFRHFHSPVVDLGDLKEQLGSLDQTDRDLVIESYKDQIYPATKEQSDEGSTNEVGDSSVGRLIFSLVERISTKAVRAGDAENLRFKDDPTWAACNTFCLARDRSGDLAIEMFHPGQTKTAKKREPYKCHGWGLMNYLTHVFDPTEHFANDQQREYYAAMQVQFETWFHAFHIRPGPVGQSTSKGTWNDERLWVGLEKMFPSPDGLVIME
jgi:hypothetical protein